MADLPIIFSGPMVRALLDGRKTQTRRIINLPTKGQYVRPDMGGWAATTVGGGGSFTVRRAGTRVPAREVVAIWNQTTGTCIATRWQVDDRLWVREAVARIDNAEFGEPSYWQYRAETTGREFPGDWPAEEKGNPERPQWKPSIHMPREASRITLIVEGVKVERLQDISEADAIAEGVGAISMLDVRRQASWSNRGDFAQLWNKLHGANAWNVNPFVVAISFRVIKANIDAAEALAA